MDQEIADNLVADYMRLTKDVLPELARTKRKDWPVREDHCFQRIVLDTVCGGVWYEHLSRPAYKHLSPQQAEQAVALCQDIAAGQARSEEHTSELQSPVPISYAVFCLKKKKKTTTKHKKIKN